MDRGAVVFVSVSTHPEADVCELVASVRRLTSPEGKLIDAVGGPRLAYDLTAPVQT